MRATGLSIYEPNPLQALQQIAEAKQRALRVVEFAGCRLKKNGPLIWRA